MAKLKPFGYKLKVVVSGTMIQVYEYTDPQWRNLTSKAVSSSPPKELMDTDILPLDERLKSRGKSNIRARTNVMRLCSSNFMTMTSKFLTLTFKEQITDIALANKEFKRFMRNLQRNVDEPIKYLAVIEFQKNGSIHYHVLLDMPYIKQDRLSKMWGKGGVTIKPTLQRITNLGLYIVKKMTIDDVDPRMIGKKSYLTSRNLTKSEEYTGKQAEFIMERLKNENRKKAYSNTYKNKLTENDINYSEYHMNAC